MPRGYRLLCSGDLHVGRRPSRVEGFLDAAQCSCAAMFGQIVARAIAERVDAVAFSGDLVDQSNKYHEAFGPLERGLRELAQAGIDVVAIAGNHDFDVLPRLAEAMNDASAAGRFHLLGRAGSWDCTLIGDGRNSPPLRVIGFSFPTERFTDNPLRTLQTSGLAGFADSDGPILGLLHADLDQPQSVYAPVMRRDLCSNCAADASMWLLGHIHRPQWIPSDGATPALLYPGSPAAMDPGEGGVHGPWIVEIDSAGRVSARQIPLSLVRYDEIEIDLTGVATTEAFDAMLPKRIREHVAAACEACAGGGSAPELLCARVRLIGATSLHRELRTLAQAAVEQLDIQVNRCRVRLDGITIDTRPPVDLRSLAVGHSVVAELSRLLLELEQSENGGVQAISPLLTQATELAEEIALCRAYQPLCGDARVGDGDDSSTARAMLRRQGLALLDELLAQKNPSPADEQDADAAEVFSS